MAPHFWWPRGTCVPAVLAPCPSGSGNVSAALWVSIPGVCMGQVSSRPWPHVLVDTDTCPWYYGFPALVSLRPWPCVLVDVDTCPRHYGPPFLVAVSDTCPRGPGLVSKWTWTRVHVLMAPQPWWLHWTRVPAALARCPSGRGHVSTVLWLPSPGVRTALAPCPSGRSTMGLHPWWPRGTRVPTALGPCHSRR